MSCVREDLKAHITDVLVGEAKTPLKERVLAHLEACASCREDRDQVAKVLGLLKDAPPWKGEAAASESEDSLSAIQRQRIESLVAGRSSAPRVKKPVMFSSSWLALAASVATVGIALTLARQGAQKPIEAPAPVAPASSVPQLPQAIEAPELFAKVKNSPEVKSLTTPAADRVDAKPAMTVAPEAMREFKRQAQPEHVTPLAQAAESNEAQPAKSGKKDALRRLRDEPGVARGVEGGAAGGITGGLPAEPPASPATTPATESRSSATPGRAQAPAGFDTFAAAPKLSKEESDRERAVGYARSSNRPPQPALSPSPRDMFFESKGTNPFVVTDEDRLATFGLDVDTASYTLARNYLNRGMLPPVSSVRVEEFINAFPNNVAAGRGGEGVFAVRADGAPNPLHAGYHIIRVALKAKDVDPRDRKPAHLTFVIDVSGSMARENRLGLVKRSLALLVDKLDERDTIGIVVYGTTGRRLLAPTSVADRDRILGAINRLSPEGSTNLEEGLDLGYDMAKESFTRGASNRVVLCTDGVANNGITDADSLLGRIKSAARGGIDMMALGFGMGNYNDALLQRLADEGNGQYAYIDDFGEARAFFLRKLTSVLEVVAYDAKAQVEFNPARVERYRLIGYEKRDIADRDFRNDAVDAGEINAGHSVTALFEVKLQGGPAAGRIGTARIRYKASPRSEGVEFEREIADPAVERSFEKASPAFRTAYVAARFAEHLRKSYWVKDESLALLRSLADELPEAQPTGELADLIRKTVRLQKPHVKEDW